MNKKISREDFSEFTELATRWSDMDSVGHVNNATFLSYFESDRIGSLPSSGFTANKFILASLKIDYFKQLDHPAKLTIGQKIARVGNKTMCWKPHSEGMRPILSPPRSRPSSALILRSRKRSPFSTSLERRWTHDC